MRISREDKEALKERILVEALPALKTMGEGGAPVDKIMKKVGLTSGALYSHFKSKDDFFNQVVLRELDRVVDMYGTLVETKGEKGLVEIIDRYLSSAHVQGVGEGCVFVALGADMHRQKASVKAQFEEKIAKIFEVSAKGLKSGSSQERVDKIAFIFASMMGSVVYARNMKSKESADAILRSTKRQVLDYLGL